MFVIRTRLRLARPGVNVGAGGISFRIPAGLPSAEGVQAEGGKCR